MLRFLRNLGLAAVIAVASTLALSWSWTAIGGGAISVHGWIALILSIKP